MQDAHEALIELIDACPSTVRTRLASVLWRAECACGFSRDTADPVRLISVAPAAPSYDLRSAISAFFEREVLAGYVCDHCGATGATCRRPEFSRDASTRCVVFHLRNEGMSPALGIAGVPNAVHVGGDKAELVAAVTACWMD